MAVSLICRDARAGHIYLRFFFLLALCLPAQFGFEQRHIRFCNRDAKTLSGIKIRVYVGMD
jgi:hypothetical protein